MSQNEICLSLNKVFELMMENKLREDMDDTLLEKLLSVIRLEISEDYIYCSSDKEKLNIIQDLLMNTQVLHLVEKVIISLNDKSVKLSPTIQRFTIELIGVLFRNKNVFTLYKDSNMLRELCNAVSKSTTTAYLPTVQSALLLCLTSIAKHFEGILWLKERNLMHFVFSSFSCSSYHVRAKAISFFTEVLSMWTPSNISLHPVDEQLLFNNIFENIVYHLLSGIRLDSNNQEIHVTNCCLLVLKNSFDISSIKKLVNNNSFLKKQLLHYFGSLTKSETVNERVLNLLICIFTSGGVSEIFIQDILKLLASHFLFTSAIDLVGSLLRDSEQYRPIRKHHIQFFTLPLKVLSGNNLHNGTDDIFGLLCTEIYNSMSAVMEAKSDCIKIIISSLLSLSKLTDFMDPEALEGTLIAISIVVSGPTCCQHHPMSYVCLENRQICFASLEFFSSILNEKVYNAMEFQNQLKVVNYLLSFIQKPFDYNVTTEALKLLGSIISINEKYSISLPNETKEKLIHLLCMKLMDKTETIVIGALFVAGLIMSKDGNQFWKDTVLNQNLHQIVWEMGVDGVQDGMLKAASLQATLLMCIVTHLWEDIQTSKRVNEEDLMKTFFRYYRDPDFYVQRESLTCIFEWLKSKENELPLTCKEHLLVILSEAMKSLDTDQKEIALNIWTWLMESDKFFPGGTQNMDKLLKAACESGFALSLVWAVEDSDEVIQYKAAGILINFRKTLQKMGCTADYHVNDDLKQNIPQVNSADVVSFEPITKDKRDAGIENVIKLTTAEQIAKLAFIPDIASDNRFVESTSMNYLSFPINSFLKYVWSNSLDCITSKPDVSTDLFSEHTLSLLDDIIASDVKDICRPLDDIPDCY